MFVYKIAWYVYDHKNQIEINKTNYLIIIFKGKLVKMISSYACILI